MANDTPPLFTIEFLLPPPHENRKTPGYSLYAYLPPFHTILIATSAGSAAGKEINEIPAFGHVRVALRYNTHTHNESHLRPRLHSLEFNVVLQIVQTGRRAWDRERDRFFSLFVTIIRLIPLLPIYLPSPPRKKKRERQSIAYIRRRKGWMRHSGQRRKSIWGWNGEKEGKKGKKKNM